MSVPNLPDAFVAIQSTYTKTPTVDIKIHESGHGVSSAVGFRLYLCIVVMLFTPRMDVSIQTRRYEFFVDIRLLVILIFCSMISISSCRSCEDARFAAERIR